MDAIERTNSLERKDISLNLIVGNENNPNKMTSREFDLLCDNINKTGITDPILVRKTGDDKYRIIGGHHRYKAAKYLGFDKIPATIIVDPEFDEEMEEFQLIRHNAIHGSLDPQMFLNLYGKYASKYGDDALQELFGFADVIEFQKLIASTKKQLPKEMQSEFAKAAKELKTVDDLAKLLNTMFTKYGNTLHYGYMIVDFGGKDSLWIRSTTATMQHALSLGKYCIDNHRSIDSVLGGILQLIAQGKLTNELEQIVKTTPKIGLPDGFTGWATEDNLKA